MAHLSQDFALKSFGVDETTSHGRNKTFSALFEAKDGETHEIRENALRFESEFGKRFGWRVFPSDWFEIKKEGDAYYFSGRGFGHGVGLCQSGALRLAQLGWDWRRILDFYFPGTNKP
jgi:SpoIID/LytB domain protein